MDSSYGCATATLSVAPSISSCNTYLRHYYYANGQRQGLTHPFISTPYRILAAPITREALEDVARWSNPGPPDPSPARPERSGQSELASQTYCTQSSSSSFTPSTPPPTRPPPLPSYQATSLPFSADSFDRLNSNSASNDGLYPHDQLTISPPSASELFEHLQPQPGEGLLLLISEYCGDGTLKELICRGGLCVGGSTADSAAGVSSLVLSSSSNLTVMWEALLLLGQVAVAMNLLHEQGLPHGCLRCNNVNIKRCCNPNGSASDRSVFLTDIGLTTLTTPAAGPDGDDGGGPLAVRMATATATSTATATATAAVAASLTNDVYDYGRLMYEVVFPGCSYSGESLPTGKQRKLLR